VAKVGHGTDRETRYGDPALPCRRRGAVSRLGGFARGILATAAAVPFHAYAFMLLYYMLLYYLTLDVISAIVSMPAKLDAIADVRRPVGDE